MTSRLDRLFVLLEAGAGPATRRAAARQLGEVQRAHPEELHRLLARLMKHLASPAWETRIAATQAVEAILANVPEWHPPPFSGVKDEEEGEECTRLRCETFDIERVLQQGAHLMGSEGHEYDVDDEGLSVADVKERLNRQRQQLNARFGLDVAATLGLDLCAVYTADDLCAGGSVTHDTTRRPVSELMSSKLSSREMNLAKRKARLAFGKQKSRDCDDGPSAPPTPPVEPDRKKVKLEHSEEYLVESKWAVPERSGAWSYNIPASACAGAGASAGASASAGAGASASAGVGASTGAYEARWPLEGWAGALQAQLFSGAWEARHGAASALRELLKAPVVTGAAKRSSMTKEQMEDAHQEWLEDMALRLLCVLALDRFGDFVSDQVVAPVRETCAQTLGVALARLRAARVRLVAAQLAHLARQPQWEARHGALLAFKYLLAARQEVAIESGALEQLTAGLDDPAEDVSGVAAGALAPAAGALAAARADSLPPLTARLWRLLRDQDELAAPAHQYMALLAALMALPAAHTLLGPVDLVDVLPRLWPYLDHSTSSVRKATLQTLRTLTRPLVNPDKPTNGETNGGGEEKKNGLNKEDDSQYLNWTPELLQEAMRHIYQRVLFEHVHEIQEIALQVWHNMVVHARLGTLLVAACPALAAWLCLAMQPPRLPADPALLLHVPAKERRTRTNSQSPERSATDAAGAGLAAGAGPPSQEAELRGCQKWYIGGSESQPCAARDRNVTRARCLAADILGFLSCYLVQPAPGIDYKAEDESPIDCYVKVMVAYLRAGSALQRLVASLVVSSWARHSRTHRMYPPPIHGGQACSDISQLAPPLLTSTLHAALSQSLYYDEVALNCNRLLQEARDLLAMMKHYKLPVDGEEFNNILRLEQVSHMTSLSEPLVAGMKAKRAAGTLEERRRALQCAVTACCGEQAALHVAVQAALAGACANLHSLPERLNPVVRPLMESVKKEGAEELQAHSADTLAVLMAQLVDREPCPNNKVLVNLKAFLRCDPEFTPRVSLESGEEAESGSGDSGAEGKPPRALREPTLDKHSGILTLAAAQKSAERVVPRRGRPRAAPAPAAPAPAAAPHDLDVDKLFVEEDEGRKLLRIQRRGATMALTSLTRYFGDELPDKLPKLWEFITQPFEQVMTDEELSTQKPEAADELISRLQVVEAVCGDVGTALWPRLAAGARACAALTRAPYTALRHMAARALAAMARRDPPAVMQIVVDELIESLESSGCERVRCGAAEAVARAADALQLRLVPYIVLLVVPLLGRMSDPCPAVRQMCTRCFATLIQLMPLDGGAADAPSAPPALPPLPPALDERRRRDRTFLNQLFNPRTIRDYRPPVPVNAELRSYQQAGVNWLRFLNEYRLHGVLCDDMGLGKTLQSIVVVAGSHAERRAQPPSLVVCPPTLTGHWVFEVNKFIPTKYLNPLQYVGPPVERERLRSLVKFHNLIVASYDIVRNDIDFFSSIKWNYCILDEGHVIKNGKTKAFKAIKQLVANHRLILSGTPIQNNVLELWSLFDFLMPGLLGTERQFTARYSRPILAARDVKATPHQLQAGALACEALHRQVLPFLLRRVKEDVLRELPPKMTQDYYCELSPLQRRLYEQFSRDHRPHDHTHVFQALYYLQNVCNHPKLVLTAEHPAAERVARQLAAQRSSLDDIEHAAKLPALKQLLLDCGIGTTSADADSTAPVVSQHRALIFCQLKKMLDIVERDLLRRHLPAVTYLRLDGSVPPQQRHAIVTRFNTDVSIDVLLLTTAVGGLGLNLTGADTVIFVEHDWNPMKDLQAMDRAHRIGQKRAVNVYRLITRDTLEEKIMGLQKFKLMTANTVISSENAAMETMGTDQLLDLFTLSGGPTPAGSTGPGGPGSSGPGIGKSVLEALPELWDDKQYEEEYDISNFIKSLNTIKE